MNGASAVDAVTADVIDLSHDGRGITEIDGQRVFVAGALPAERVLLKTRKRRRRYQEAELVEIVAAAETRVEPGCPYFGVCGGCAVQHLDYPAQVRFKQGVVAEALSRLGGVEPETWLPPITGRQWHYRRRARLGVKYVHGKGRVLVGFRERAAPYVADMAACRVLVPPMDRLPAELAGVIAASTLKQRIPQAEIAVGDEGGAVVLRVLDPPATADRDAFAEFGQRLGVDIYLQTGGPDTIEPLGEASPLFYRLERDGLRLDFEPGDFIQINAEINQAMVAAAIDAAEIEPTDRVLDLYCGLGNFSLPIAKRAGEVLGVEGSASLVARAARNAEQNGLSNVRFVAADLDQADWPFFAEQWDVVFVDPARNGAEAAVGAIAAMRPRRLIYVSCHPGTLARDAGRLVEQQGYRLSSARVLDMFPNTHHVEAITIFDRNA
ncbi:MAG: 23S rRNA (uracil(1939)-C(5))-methyltransferase RlmD [Gammaproteobacteria bacterium]|nr:23S rRNA (uracil(1939)-C(5))-methyltransferase RlmD [Gammaproteobacteria bacterium]